MFHRKEIYNFTHGPGTAAKLMGSTPHDQLLMRTSESFSGLLLFAIGFLLFMVPFVRDRQFQSFFAKGCTLLHVFMALWRVCLEKRVEVLAWDWLRQTVGDVPLALSWVFFLVLYFLSQFEQLIMNSTIGVSNIRQFVRPFALVSAQN
uniref:Uncharacterized protein MANES_17G046000 n=1 Tax=Rhizophora mucronata TaxID=61149 RepID=A0A2P2NJS5_RHIMU